MQHTRYDTVIVGAGAAGLIAAGHASECGKKVLLLEKMDKPGRKLFITGKGRCNITNNAAISEYMLHIYPDGRFLRQAFSRFFAPDIVKLLEALGVPVTVERGERVFPTSNKSSDVVKALGKYAQQHGAELWTGARAELLTVRDGQIAGISGHKDGKPFTAEAGSVIICTGGLSYPATGSDGDGYTLARKAGHTVHPAHPALTGIEVRPAIPAEMAGLNPKNVRLSLWSNGKKLREEFGDMMFTHQGLSGPVVLTLSRFAIAEWLKKNKVELVIDFKPALDEPKLDARLQRDLDEHGKKLLVNTFKLWLPSQIIPEFVKRTGIDPYKECHQVNAKERRRIMLLMKDYRFEMTGHRPFSEAIITAGGVSTSEINPKTMESRLVKGLYFAGEVIDVDADTGGYNLQIAFSTGWLAADNISCNGQ